MLKAKRLLSTLLIFPKPARQTNYRLNYRATQQFPAVPPGRLTALLGLRELHLLSTSAAFSYARWDGDIIFKLQSGVASNWERTRGEIRALLSRIACDGKFARAQRNQIVASA